TQLKEVTKQAGLTLQSLVVRSIAAARAIPPETMATGTTLVVCPVGDWVDLTLLADGHPLLARTVRPSAAADSESWNQRVMAEVRRTLLAAPSGALPEGNIDRIVVLTPPHDADDTSVGLGQFLQQQLVTQVGTLDVSSSLDAEALAQ